MVSLQHLWTNKLFVNNNINYRELVGVVHFSTMDYGMLAEQETTNILANK